MSTQQMHRQDVCADSDQKNRDICAMDMKGRTTFFSQATRKSRMVIAIVLAKNRCQVLLLLCQ